MFRLIRAFAARFQSPAIGSIAMAASAATAYGDESSAHTVESSGWSTRFGHAEPKASGEDLYSSTAASLSFERIPLYARPHAPGPVTASDIPTALPPALPEKGVAHFNANLLSPAGAASIRAAIASKTWIVVLPRTDITDSSDALYALRLSRGRPVRVRSLEDAIELSNAISVVFVTRGCHGDVAKALEATAAAIAARDPAGFAFYIVDDETPDDLARRLEHRIRIPLGEPWSGDASRAEGAGAAPVVIICDRMTRMKRRYALPMAAPRADSDAVRAALHALPTHGDVTSFLDSWQAGGILPSLMGEARPPGDRDADFPSLYALTPASFQDVVLDPSHDVVLGACGGERAGVLLLPRVLCPALLGVNPADTYVSGCPMCASLKPRMAMLALLAERFFPRIRVAGLNIDNNDRPKDWVRGARFPNVQMYNGGDPAATFSKLRGPSCGGVPADVAVDDEEDEERPAQPTNELVAELALRNQAETGWQAYMSIYQWLFKPAAVERPPHVFGTTNQGSVPCVQGLDFRSLGNDGRMLMPTLPDLVSWVAAHSSIPFDPAGIRVPRSALRAYASAEASDASDASASQETISLVELAAVMEDDASVLANCSRQLMALERYHDETTSDDRLAKRSPELAACLSSLGELIAEAQTGLSTANRRLDGSAALAALKPAGEYFYEHLYDEYLEWEAAQRQNSKPAGGD